MKHSKYVMCGLWDVPESYSVEYALAVNAKGQVTHSRKIPAFIAKYKTDKISPEGFIVCVRRMTLDIKPPEAPS